MFKIIMNRVSQKKIVILFSTLGFILSFYGYYELLSIVPVFAEILGIFESSLAVTSKFIIQTHYYYGFISNVGFLALLLTLFNKISPIKAYLLCISNIVLMFSIRWFTAHELNKSILSMGVIQ